MFCDMLALLTAVIFLLIFSRAAIAGSATDENSAGLECKRVLEGITRHSSPFGTVGHTLHYLTVRDLRRYFDPKATERNFIPTVNRNLNASDVIQPHAPDLSTPDDQQYLTDTMKDVNLALSHMDDVNYDIKSFSPLERLVHMFHMHEMWAHTSRAMKEIEKEASPSKDACRCILDTKNNGKYLKFIAMVSRGLVSKAFVKSRSDLDGSAKAGELAMDESSSNAMVREKRKAKKEYYENNYYSNGRRKRGNGPDSDDSNWWINKILGIREDQLQNNDQISEREAVIKPVEYAATKNKDDASGDGLFSTTKEVSLPELDSAENWKIWNKVFNCAIKPDQAYNSALFIHCAIKKSHKETDSGGGNL